MSDQPMNEMVERVARAIANELSIDDDDARDAALAALTAMRSPTSQMIEAAQLSYGGPEYEYGLNDEDIGEAFTAMIDSALNEQTDK